MDGVRRLLEVMKRLRDPHGGCPWDRRQTFHTIAPYTIEEAYEVADVIARERWSELPGELGDLLFQVVFHAQMASEEHLFDFDDVAHAVVEKMIRRHPHVFANQPAGEAAGQSVEWESRKTEERRARGDASLMDSMATGLPAIRRALKLQRRAATVGFDWPAAGPVFSKVREELAELEQVLESDAEASRLRAELGDLLFTCVNLARHLELDPETALGAANLKFESRFRHMENESRRRGETLESMDEGRLDELWEQAKEDCS